MFSQTNGNLPTESIVISWELHHFFGKPYALVYAVFKAHSRSVIQNFLVDPRPEQMVQTCPSTCAFSELDASVRHKERSPRTPAEFGHQWSRMMSLRGTQNRPTTRTCVCFCIFVRDGTFQTKMPKSSQTAGSLALVIFFVCAATDILLGSIYRTCPQFVPGLRDLGLESSSTGSSFFDDYPKPVWLDRQ